MGSAVVLDDDVSLCSVNHLLDLLVETVNTGGQAHVHELRLGVHLQAAEDGLIDLELDDELLALVLGVGLERAEDLLLLLSGEAVGREDGDLLLLVELLIELGVLVGNLLDEHETLVLSKDLNEADGDLVEITGLLQALVELLDLLEANTSVLGEELEGLGVAVELGQELHVLVHFIEGACLRSGGEEHGGVAARDGVLLGGGLVVGSRLDALDVAQRERLVEGIV